jgi:NADH dehydrogenase
MSDELAVVTGAFGYTGRQIASRLIERDIRVRTLTRVGRRSDLIDVRPYTFEDPKELADSLRGASVLYNTYWVRFARGRTDFDLAVRNSVALFEAAQRAGVGRIVHVSITNPFRDPPLPYFRGKAMLELALRESGVSHAIVRPTVMFGAGDVFINNIAWLLRTFPLFPVPGSGRYRLQPVHVGDVADLCLDAAARSDDTVVDAAGPEIFAFEDLLLGIRNAVGAHCRLVHTPPPVALALAGVVSLLTEDVVITGAELAGLMRELIVSEHPPSGSTRFSDWLVEHGMDLGRRYESELKRNFRRPKVRS